MVLVETIIDNELHTDVANAEAALKENEADLKALRNLYRDPVARLLYVSDLDSLYSKELSNVVVKIQQAHKSKIVSTILFHAFKEQSAEGPREVEANTLLELVNKAQRLINNFSFNSEIIDWYAQQKRADDFLLPRLADIQAEVWKRFDIILLELEDAILYKDIQHLAEDEPMLSAFAKPEDEEIVAEQEFSKWMKRLDEERKLLDPVEYFRNKDHQQ